MDIKARVQAHHFSSDSVVTVQLQGVESSGGWSASGPASREQAAKLPVGAVVVVTIEAAD